MPVRTTDSDEVLDKGVMTFDDTRLVAAVMLATIVPYPTAAYAAVDIKDASTNLLYSDGNYSTSDFLEMSEVKS